MEFNVLKRDLQTLEWRHDCLLGPENKQNYMTLARYQVTEEKLREVREALKNCDCFVNRLTVSSVNFNDKKASLLAQGIEHNDSLTELHIKNCKIKPN